MSFEFKPKSKKSGSQSEMNIAPAESNQQVIMLKKTVKHMKPSRKMIGIVIGAAVVFLIALVACLFIVRAVTAPVRIIKIEMQKSLSSRVEDAPVQKQFKKGEPIMLHFQYDKAKVDTAVSFAVKDSKNQAVRSGSTTVLRADNKSKADGQRFISIVNGPSTALPVGKYTVTLSVKQRVITTIKFEVIK